MGLSQVIAWTQSLGPFINEGSVGFIFGCAGLALLAGASGLNSSECQSGLSTLKFFTVGAAIRTWRAFRFVSQLGTSRKGLPPLPKTPKDPTISRPLKNQRSTPEPKIEAKAPRAKTGKKATALKQQNLNLGQEDEYQIPALEILEAAPAVTGVSIAKDALQQNAHYLSTVLEDFGVHGEIVKVRPGPVVTLYELEPAPGTKTSRVVGLSDDIARSMSAISVRVAVVPGRNVIGIELPNADREMVYLRELLESDTLERASGSLNIALGKDIGGNPVAVDLARMPHLLIAGTTGSGKSVAVNTMILSLLYQYTPDQCKFIMIDPKMLELSVYEGIPHLLAPVVTDPPKAVMALKWTVREMEDRYRTM
ncbi:MAG: DNA translocase FtsK, partial [Rhodospirillales bacterium]|nr:DNA translocase FtsK [Rhodospirillales bacterium]